MACKLHCVTREYQKSRANLANLTTIVNECAAKPQVTGDPRTMQKKNAELKTRRKEARKQRCKVKNNGSELMED